MARAKKTSKHERLRKALPLLEIAGLSLSLAGGAAASTDGPAPHTPSHDGTPKHEVLLSEEEMHDVSLATFYLFDRENSATFDLAQQQADPRRPQSDQPQPPAAGAKKAGRCRCGGCAGCAGCASCGASSSTSRGATDQGATDQATFIARR